ncbi:hypothetical protein BpHYR1_000076 [Brachionus plicatilis]|uniref:Uncharacterized protein n=1 Tax=Brachionus plicatilis TaxID=10195 RepID=A0A3M7PIX1_BRAPC|nr:hypothetical protein BpHYR1_000076 [Brachionus plicatilis]
MHIYRSISERYVQNFDKKINYFVHKIEYTFGIIYYESQFENKESELESFKSQKSGQERKNKFFQSNYLTCHVKNIGKIVGNLTYKVTSFDLVWCFSIKIM